MLVLSDRLPIDITATDRAVFKSATVPQSVRVSNVDGGKTLIVQHGHISILVSLTSEEAEVVACALSSPDGAAA